MNVRASIAALVLVTVSLAPSAARSQHAGRPPAAPAPRNNAPRETLPDSVLARVDFSRGHTLLTATGFRNAAFKLQADPDSLAPAARRELVGMMVQQAVLDHRVGETPPRWLHRDSTNFESYADGLVLRAALDSALAELRSRLAARGDTVPPTATLMIMVRDSAIAGLRVVYDEAGIGSLAAAFAALPVDDGHLPSARRREVLSAQPRLSARDSAAVLGRCEVGEYSVLDLLRDRASLGVLHRPNVSTASALHSLVDDNLYTMLLRREARRQRLEARPDIAPLLAVRRQFLTVQRFVQNEAYDRVAVDTATVRRYFDREARRYDLGATAQIVRTLLARRSAADSAVRELAQPGYAETLSTRSLRPGLSYLTTLGEDADTVLYARVRRAGVGAVIGPDPTSDGWRVFKVMSLTPRKPQTLEQAFLRARSDWVELDGDRRMRELMSKLGAACRVTRNDSSSWLTGRRRAAR